MENMDAQKELSQNLKKIAEQEGFSPVGIARVPGSSQIELRTKALENWIDAGFHADMGWMSAPRRKRIDSLLEGVKSVLAVGLNYYVDIKPSPNCLSIARYAWGNDYHKLIEVRLKRVANWLKNQKPQCRMKICVDSSPLLDKAWAEEAGLGWIGKNSNLINKKSGSWMVIGHLLCTEALTPDKPSKPRCGICQACITACPTNAITEPFIVNSNRCLAYHTIENRNSELPNEIIQSLGKWVAGCDICQEVCPWNHKKIPIASDPEIQPKPWILNLKTDQAISWSDQEWKIKVRGSALKRIKPWMWRRNAKAIQKNRATKDKKS